MHNHIAFTNFVHFNKNEDLFGGPIPAKKCLNFVVTNMVDFDSN